MAIPSGNLRKLDTWDSFFEEGMKKQARARLAASGGAAPGLARSPKAVKSIPPLRSAPTPAPTHTTASPDVPARAISPAHASVHTHTQRRMSNSLRPHTARTRDVYAGPPGPGQYASSASQRALSTVRTVQSSGFGGTMANQDRSRTGPFGHAHTAGAKPGPGHYLSQDYGRPNPPPCTAPSTFGFAGKDVMVERQVDPLMRHAPRGELSPGPGAYPLDGSSRLLALDQSLKSLAAASPGTKAHAQRAESPDTQSGAQVFTFSATGTSDRIKFSSSRAKSPAAVQLATSEHRFNTGPFGKIEMIRAGVENPAPSSYNVLSGGKTPSLAKSTFGGTGDRSNPMGRVALYNPCWMPVASFSTLPVTGPGSYEGAAASTLGKQTTSTKPSAATVKFPEEGRDKRYNYFQPGFTRGADKPFDIPPPNAYDLDAVRITPKVAGGKIGTAGRSPVGIVYS